jgi:transaldolase
MKIFLDSADINEIKQAYEWGVADGVTTNPSLVKKAVESRKSAGENIDIKTYFSQILEIAKGTPVSLEVTETGAMEMYEQGVKLFDMFNSVAGNVNIKVPVNTAFSMEDKSQFAGLQAIKKLSEKDIPVNCTLIFTPEQALLAAKAGAKYLSPFAGRIDDLLRSNAEMNFNKTDYYPSEGIETNNGLLEDNGVYSGIDLIEQCVDIVEQYEFNSEIIAASIRNSRQARECALAGAHISTLPYSVIKEMLMHKKTFEGMRAFTNDIVPEYANLTK